MTGAKDTSCRQQASVNNICHGICHASFNSKVHQSSSDHLFKNQENRRAFRTFLKCGSSSSVKTSLSFLIRSDAVMTAAIDSLADFIYVIKTSANNSSWRTCLLAGDDRLVERNKGVTMSQERKGMKEMIPVAASNILNSFNGRFCRKFANRSELERAEIATRNLGSTAVKMNNESGKYTIRFKMADTGHFYIALTAHAI